MLINVYFLKLPQQSTHSWGWTAICVCRGRYVFSQPQLFIKQILTYMDYNNLSVPVYRNCKQKAIYNEMRMEEIFHKVKNDIELRVCTEAYRNALMLKLPESQLKKMKTETFPMLLPAVFCEDERHREVDKRLPGRLRPHEARVHRRGEAQAEGAAVCGYVPHEHERKGPSRVLRLPHAQQRTQREDLRAGFPSGQRADCGCRELRLRPCG